MRLYLLECGTCTLGWEVLIPHGGPPGQVTVPIPALLLQSDEGTYLIDTGMPDEWIGRGGNLDGEAIYPHMTADDAIEQRLAAVGLRPRDLTCVINTHLHFDHAGGNAHVTGVPIMLQDAELAAARAGAIDFQGWDLPGLRYETIRGDYHVCAGLDLLFTPGHTPGHQSVLVTLDEGQRLLFTIDAVYTGRNWHDDLLGAMSDPAAGQHSVERLRYEAAQPGTTVVFGHDPGQWATLRHPPDYYA